MEFDFFEMSRRLERVHTPRLALRPATLADAWPLYEATRNPQFNRFLTWPAPEGVDAMLERVDGIVRASRNGDMSAFSAVSLETGAFVGMLRYMRHDSRPDALEMGVWVSDRWWHGRMGLELGFVAVDAAFELTDAAVLSGQARPENRSSCALMRSVGMIEQASTTRRLEDGTTVAACEFTIGRDEWMQRRRRGFGYYGLDGRMSEFGAPQAPRRESMPVSVSDAVATTAVDDAPPRDPPARVLALEALRTAAATAASSVSMGAVTAAHRAPAAAPAPGIAALPAIGADDLSLAPASAADPRR